MADSLSHIFQEQPTGGGIGSSDIGLAQIIGGFLASLGLGPEFGLPFIGSGFDSLQAADRNQQTDALLAAGLPGIESGIANLTSAANQPVLTQDQIREGIGQPGGAINDIVQQLLPMLQQLGTPSGIDVDLDALSGRIGGLLGGTAAASSAILSPERITSILEPIRLQREGVLQGGRIDDPLSLGRDIIGEVGAEFGTPQTQFALAGERATTLARQNVSGLGNLEENQAARLTAERSARLPIASQAELSNQRSEAARAIFEGGILQASGAQGQNLNQRLTELEAGGFDTISNAVSAGNLRLPDILAALAQTGVQGQLGIGGLSLEKERLEALVEGVGFENALKLLGIETGAAAGVEGDKTALLNALLGQGNIDRQTGLAGGQVGINALQQILALALNRPDILVPASPAFNQVGQQLLASQQAPDDSGFFDFASLGSGVGTIAGLLAAPATGGLSAALIPALAGGAIGGTAGGIANQFQR